MPRLVSAFWHSQPAKQPIIKQQQLLPRQQRSSMSQQLCFMCANHVSFLLAMLNCRLLEFVDHFLVFDVRLGLYKPRGHSLAQYCLCSLPLTDWPSIMQPHTPPCRSHTHPGPVSSLSRFDSCILLDPRGLRVALRSGLVDLPSAEVNLRTPASAACTMTSSGCGLACQ